MADEFYRRKPARYEIVDRVWEWDRPCVHLLEEGRAKAVSVPWDDFQRDYEVATEETEPAKRRRIGEWMVTRMPGADLPQKLYCYSEHQGRVWFGAIDFYPHAGSSMLFEEWDRRRAEWIAKGCPS